MPPPFLFARSRGLWEGEDGKNGRTKPDDSGKLRWIAASAMAEGPRTRSALRPEQWPQYERVRGNILPRCRRKSRSSHGEAAELRRHGSRANGSLNWAAWARVVLEGALICSISEGGRGKDSPPALPERRMQMSAMKARVRKGVAASFLNFHIEKNCRCGRGELVGRLGTVLPFHEGCPESGANMAESSCIVAFDDASQKTT